MTILGNYILTFKRFGYYAFTTTTTTSTTSETTTTTTTVYSGTPEVVDSYAEANRDDQFDINANAAFRKKLAQTFTPAANYTLTSAKFYIQRVNTITGNVNVKLYAHTGTYGSTGYPTGAALATSGNIDASTISDAGYVLVEFTFTGGQQYSMASGTHYCISVEYEGSETTNYLRVGTDMSSGTHGGNAAAYISAWSETVGDFVFYVYGIPQ